MTKERKAPAGSSADTTVHVELEPAHPPARVEIAAGGHQVVVEAAMPLATVANTALEMWRSTDSADRAREVGAMGFRDERCDGPLPADLTLPDRLAGTDGLYGRRAQHRWAGFEQQLRDRQWET